MPPISLIPLTGQGIYLALHSATLAAAVAHRVLCSGALSADALRSYFLAHRQAFRDKYRLSALIQLGLRVPWLANHVIDRLARRPALADIVVGVAGDFVLPKACFPGVLPRRSFYEDDVQ